MAYRFHVGQRVVCVDASNLVKGHGSLEEGAIYTLRYVGRAALRSGGVPKACCATGVRLVEVDRGKVGGREPVFCARRFRPLIETDISIFTAMLTTAPAEPEREDA